MRRSDCGSSYRAPASHIPERGKGTGNSLQDSVSKQPCDIFANDQRGPDFVHDPMHLPPKAGAVAVQALAIACDADVLAGESSQDEINMPTKAAAVEGGNVRPDRRRRQATLADAREEDVATIGVPLHISGNVESDAQAAKGEFDAEVEAADSRKERKSPESGNSHIVYQPAARASASASRPASVARCVRG